MLTAPAQLLRAREARSLAWAIGARIALLGIPVVLGLMQVLGLIGPGIVAESDTEALLASLLGATLAVVAYRGLQLARQERHLAVVGGLTVTLDIVFLALLPVIWLQASANPDPLPAFLLKNELFTVSVLLIGVNALALSPRYPAIMTAGAVAVHLGVLAVVLRDPRVVYADSFEVHFTTAAVNPGVVQGRIVALAVLGAALWFVTRSARRLIHDAVALEAANHAMRDRQAQLVAEGRMSALTSLVSGIAHELNSPLGAVKSSLQTTERCAQRLSELPVHGVDDNDTTKTRSRVLSALAQSAAVGGQAVDRLSGLVGSLKRFALLDEAEVQRADLREGLQSTLSLLDDGLKGDAEISLQSDELPALLCRPKELNQVFRTLAVNALEALAGKGELRVVARHEGEHIQIRFADSGPGIEADRLANLFELAFEETHGRVGMGLGLVTSRRIVERHGGELKAESTPGQGSCFIITLPVRTMLESRAG